MRLGIISSATVKRMPLRGLAQHQGVDVPNLKRDLKIERLKKAGGIFQIKFKEVNLAGLCA